MKATICIVLFSFISTVCYSQKSNTPEELLSQFLNDMKNGNDLIEFLYDYENIELSEPLEVDFVMIETYEITPVSKMVFKVIVDTGFTGKCLELIFNLKENNEGDIKILVGEVEYLEIIKKKILTPWQSKKKVC